MVPFGLLISIHSQNGLHYLPILPLSERLGGTIIYLFNILGQGVPREDLLFHIIGLSKWVNWEGFNTDGGRLI